MSQDAPFRLLVSTMICIVIVNVVLAQVITQTFYSGAGLRLGPAVLAVLVFAAVGSVVYTVRGWRAYMRRRPGP